MFIIICIISCDVASRKMVIFVKGSRSMSYVFEKIANEYIKSERSESVNLPNVIYGLLPNEKNNIEIPQFDRSKIEFIFLEGGSGRGVGSLLDGNRNGEIILSTRDLTASEIRTIENINRTYLGDVIYLFKYAEDNIIPVVNVRNPKDSISKLEIKQILQGRIKSWTNIFPFTEDVEYIYSEEGLRIDNTMQISMREPSSSINFYLKTRILSGIITEDILEIASDMEIIDYVSKIFNSISFVSSTYRPILSENGIKELEITEAVLDASGIISETNVVENIDGYMRKNCNIIFMKNQDPIEGLEELGKDITVDDVILDFINFSNSYKTDESQSDKGRDISRSYFSFEFINN
jgi:ABC-type phosphate transport system substrate-binding protein